MPSLGKAVLYFCGAALCALLAWNVRMPEWLRYFLAATAIIFGAAGLVELINYLVMAWVERTQEVRELELITPAREILRVMAALSPMAQVELAEKFPTAFGGLARLGMVGDRPVLVYQVRMGGEDIPLAFVREFMGKSDHRHCAAVRSWGEGSVGRRWAQAVTEQLIGLGWASPAVGNQAAQWVIRGQESCYFRARELFDLPSPSEEGRGVEAWEGVERTHGGGI